MVTRLSFFTEQSLAFAAEELFYSVTVSGSRKRQSGILSHAHSWSTDSIAETLLGRRRDFTPGGREKSEMFLRDGTLSRLLTASFFLQRFRLCGSEVPTVFERWANHSFALIEIGETLLVLPDNDHSELSEARLILMLCELLKDSSAAGMDWFVDLSFTKSLTDDFLAFIGPIEGELALRGRQLALGWVSPCAIEIHKFEMFIRRFWLRRIGAHYFTDPVRMHLN